MLILWVLTNYYCRVTGASSAGTLSFVWTMEGTKIRLADDYGSASGEEEF